MIVDLSLHIFKIIISLLLTCYVFVKPNDHKLISEDNFSPGELGEDKNYKCIHRLLDKFENISFIQMLFRYKLDTKPLCIPLVSASFLNENNSFNIPKSDSVHMRRALSNQDQPTRCFPEFRRIIVELGPKSPENHTECSLDILNPNYLIRTKMNDKIFESRRQYEEILELYRILSDIYNSKDFPDYSESFPEYNTSIDPKDIEEFLNELIAEPAFIHPRFLEFLRITKNSDKKVFLEYFSSIVPKRSLILESNPSKKRKNSLISPANRRNSETNAEFRETDENLTTFSMLHFNFRKTISFEINCTGWEKSQSKYFFVFQMKCLPGMFTWEIKKSFSQLKSFNLSLEETLKRTISVFRTCVSKKTVNFSDMDEKFLEERKKGLEKYMKEILNDKTYYDELLYKFIEFDIDKRMPIAAAKYDDPMDYSLTDDQDEILPNKLEEHSPVQIHSLKEENLIWIEENPGKRGIIKHNELWSPSLKNKRRVVSDINFNNVRIIFNGVKRTMVQQNSKMNRTHSSNGRIQKSYFINLEEVEISNFSVTTTNHIRTVIKLSKNYTELEEFDIIIRTNFENEYLPELPEDVTDEGATFQAKKETRKLWEEYFSYMINIPLIEENQTFKEFFHLDKARNKYMYDSEKKETFKLDLTYL